MKISGFEENSAVIAVSALIQKLSIFFEKNSVFGSNLIVFGWKYGFSIELSDFPSKLVIFTEFSGFFAICQQFWQKINDFGRNFTDFLQSWTVF